MWKAQDHERFNIKVVSTRKEREAGWNAEPYTTFYCSIVAFICHQRLIGMRHALIIVEIFIDLHYYRRMKFNTHARMNSNYCE